MPSIYKGVLSILKTLKEINKSLLNIYHHKFTEHITFLGHYDFDSSLSLGVNEYRKLKVEENI